MEVGHGEDSRCGIRLLGRLVLVPRTRWAAVAIDLPVAVVAYVAAEGDAPDKGIHIYRNVLIDFALAMMCPW